MTKTYKALGLMSGTSMDGIDAAIIITDGYKVLETLAGKTFPYNGAFREKLRQLIKGAGDRNEVEEELTHLHANAVANLLESANEDKTSIDLIGFHGHTIDHRPQVRSTTQIGDGQLLSNLTGITVVNDFRTADVKAGGQGAPLVPIYHQALFAGEDKPVAVINIGGVANVTWIGKNDGDLLAFDTGPGNALLDDWVRIKTGKIFDDGGNLSKSGKVDEALLAKFMQDNFFAQKPPKSLDRNHFAPIPDNYNISTEDGAATLAAFTAESIALASKYFPEAVTKWIIAGGGRYNIAIMECLKKRLGAPVININELGQDGDMLEAQAFAFLAVRSVLGLPISFPGTTGITAPMCGGKMWEPI